MYEYILRIPMNESRHKDSVWVYQRSTMYWNFLGHFLEPSVFSSILEREKYTTKFKETLEFSKYVQKREVSMTHFHRHVKF